MYDEPVSAHEGRMFKIYDVPESPTGEECLRYMVSRSRQMRGHVSNEGACCGEAESPHEGAWLRYMVSRNRQTRGHI